MKEIMYDKYSIMNGQYPVIQKLGILNSGGETSPFVWKGKLTTIHIMDETIGVDKTKTKGTAVVDSETGDTLSIVGADTYFHSIYIEDDTAYIIAVTRDPWDTVMIYESKDLVHWDERVLFHNPGWIYCNTSLTKSPDGYVLMIEAGIESDTPEEIKKHVGEYYTMFFMTSPDLKEWTPLDYGKYHLTNERYTGGPWFKYSEGWYYAIVLERLPRMIYTNYISRSKDLETWEMGKYNPILMPSNEDKNISPNMRNVTEKDLERIRTGYNINNSDIDMCDWQGKTYITYACGNQQGNSWNADAIYDGTVAEFLKAFFD